MKRKNDANLDHYHTFFCLTSCMTAVLKTIVVNWSKKRSYSWRWHWFSVNNCPFSCSSWRIWFSRVRVCWVSTLVVHCYWLIDRKKSDMRHMWTIFLFISYLPKPQADQYVCVIRHFHFWDVTHVRQTHGSSSSKYKYINEKECL
jgi:hypothetical protein